MAARAGEGRGNSLYTYKKDASEHAEYKLVFAVGIVCGMIMR